MTVHSSSSTGWPLEASLVPVPDDADVYRVQHRDLPVLHEGELGRMVGFVRIVRLLGTMLGTLGALAAVSGIMLGLPGLAVCATLMSSLILYALWEDTRLAAALELLRSRRTHAAEDALAKIADSPRRSPWQRQRARTYLASLAWRRGDVDQALQWIQAWLTNPRRGREDPTDRWLAQATEAQLLAQAGHCTEARKALTQLAPPAPDGHAELVAVQTSLLVAFIEDDPDAVRPSLERWEPMVRQRDGVGVTLALLAWAYDGCGSRDRATDLVGLVRQHGDRAHLAEHYFRLDQWIELFGDGLHYGRR